MVGEDGLITALEPELENYKILEGNIKLNGLENIVPLLMALLNFEVIARLSLAKRNSGPLPELSREQ